MEDYKKRHEIKGGWQMKAGYKRKLAKVGESMSVWTKQRLVGVEGTIKLLLSARLLFICNMPKRYNKQ